MLLYLDFRSYFEATGPNCFKVFWKVLGINTLCPLSKSQYLAKEGILDMVRENAHFQKHAWGYFAILLNV